MYTHNAHKGFTLIELLVVIAIIAILAAILFPVFARAREKARQTACLNNQRQICIAAQMYAQDHDETLPQAATFWQDVRLDKATLVCPSRSELPNGYVVMNSLSGKAIGTFETPHTEMVTCDGKTATKPVDLGGAAVYQNVAFLPKDVNLRHNKSMIASYLDGHVQMTKYVSTDLPALPITNGLYSWYKSGSLAGSDAVGTWVDASGNGRDLLFTGSGAGSQTPIVHGTVGGVLPTAFFNGKCASQYGGGNLTRPCTIFLLYWVSNQVRYAPWNPEQGYLTGTMLWGETYGNGIGFNWSSPYTPYQTYWNEGFPDSPYLMVLREDTNTSNIWMNNVLRTTASNTQNWGRIRMGNNYNPVSEWAFYGDMGEVIVYNRALSDQEIATVTDYYYKKWSL